MSVSGYACLVGTRVAPSSPTDRPDPNATEREPVVRRKCDKSDPSVIKAILGQKFDRKQIY